MDACFFLGCFSQAGRNRAEIMNIRRIAERYTYVLEASLTGKADCLIGFQKKPNMLEMQPESEN